MFSDPIQSKITTDLAVMSDSTSKTYNSFACRFYPPLHSCKRIQSDLSNARAGTLQGLGITTGSARHA